MTEIHNQNQSATVIADFDAVRTRLQENPCWGAGVLQNAGKSAWRVFAARMYSRGPLGARIIDDGPDCVIAWGIIGRQSSLAYRIERERAKQVRITPLAYLERTRKTAMVVTLVLLFVLPVLLAPLLARLQEMRVLRASREYLPTFGRYLEQ
jgi:hypothetical protein